MAFTIVQIMLALLLAAQVCMGTKQDLNRMAVGVVRQIDKLSEPTLLSLPTDVDHIELLRRGHFQHEIARSNSTDNEETRRKRYITITERMNVIDTINSLRSYAGASDMNYLTYSNSFEDDAVNWTRYCDYDATFYVSSLGYLITSATASQPDYVSVLSTAFNSSDFYYALRSVELRSVGAAYSYCPNARVDGKNYTNVYLSAYAFSNTSNFNRTVPQYTPGEACTTCRSGRYWCYQGLCKDDCSASYSNCVCNSYCLNCANTGPATCRCQCPEGWTGLRCESNDGTNATEPTCITTPRIPVTWTTKIISTSTTTKAPTTTNSGMNVVPIGESIIQLSLYTAIALCLRLYNHVD